MFGFWKPSSTRTYGSSHVIRTKRGKHRYYPSGSLRRRVRKSGKLHGWSKKKTKRANSAGWW